jgi:hypothetical protein
VELKDWVDLAFSLHDSRTRATWLVISSNLDSIVVIRDDKQPILPPYHNTHVDAKGQS